MLAGILLGPSTGGPVAFEHPEDLDMLALLCLTCGSVGCCNDSKNKHAEQHFRDTAHPIIRSLQDGDGWQYCYVDQTLIREPAGSANRN